MKDNNKYKPAVTPMLSFTIDQKYGMLKLLNAVKDLDTQMTEGVPLEYSTLETIRSGEWLLSNVFNFKQPKCEHGYANHWSEYRFAEDLPEEKKEEEEDDL